MLDVALSLLFCFSVWFLLLSQYELAVVHFFSMCFYGTHECNWLYIFCVLHTQSKPVSRAFEIDLHSSQVEKIANFLFRWRTLNFSRYEMIFDGFSHLQSVFLFLLLKDSTCWQRSYNLRFCHVSFYFLHHQSVLYDFIWSTIYKVDFDGIFFLF